MLIQSVLIVNQLHIVIKPKLSKDITCTKHEYCTTISVIITSPTQKLSSQVEWVQYRKKHVLPCINQIERYIFSLNTLRIKICQIFDIFGLFDFFDLWSGRCHFVQSYTESVNRSTSTSYMIYGKLSIFNVQLHRSSWAELVILA